MGGMERVAVNLADAFAETGHESHLIFFKDRDNVLFPQHQEVRLHHFNLDLMMHLSIVGAFWELLARLLNALVRRSYFLWKGLFIGPLFALRLRLLERRHGRFDLIIIRGQGTFEMIWPLKDRRIVQVAENILHEHRSGILPNFYRRRLFAGKNVACVSEGVERSFHAIEQVAGFRARKVRTVTNPIDLVRTRRMAEEYTPDVPHPYIVSVGRIVPNKNLPLLVDAYDYARRHLGLEHRLVIVGDGSDRRRVERQVETLGLGASVRFAGMQTNPYPWMRHADLFVLSSRFEGLGMVLLEALACGTDVVATRSPGGVADVMRGSLAGHLAEQTPEALGTKIVEVLRNKKGIVNEAELERFSPQTITGLFLQTFAEEKGLL